jgi:hypothetical protein
MDSLHRPRTRAPERGPQEYRVALRCEHLACPCARALGCGTSWQLDSPRGMEAADRGSPGQLLTSMWEWGGGAPKIPRL